ncbi:hypothetical protein ACFWV1_13110 [Streptomyces sp. NPDC058700]|uniref:hypothetical protein n=1 Tax=Streptomyces sp. NPDC058700 TaxID=3346607 RepID=UPI00365A322C
MGYQLRRDLREALGPDIKGLQRAVALEIADDANDITRESLVKLETLALWTGAGSTHVVRNALKRLSEAGWEFRVPIGTGRDGRTLFAVPGIRTTFKVPPFTTEGVAAATPKGEQGLPHGGAGAPSEEAGAPSEGAGATPFSSPPHSPQEEEASTAGGAPATPSASRRELTAEEMQEFGKFWLLHPKSKNQDKTRELFAAAVLDGTAAAVIAESAAAYSREVAGQEFRFIKQSDNWLRDKRYLDKHAPEPSGRPNLRAIPGGGGTYRPHPATGAAAPAPTAEDYEKATPF